MGATMGKGDRRLMRGERAEGAEVYERAEQHKWGSSGAGVLRRFDGAKRRQRVLFLWSVDCDMRRARVEKLKKESFHVALRLVH